MPNTQQHHGHHAPLHLLHRHGMTRGDGASVRHAAEEYPANTPVEHMLCVLARIAVHTHSLLEEFMSELDDLKQQVADVTEASAAANQRVSQDLAALHGQIDGLISGSPSGDSIVVPRADLVGLRDSLAATKQTIDSIDPAAAAAPPVEGSPAEEATEDPATEAAEDAPPPAGDVAGAGQPDPGAAPTSDQPPPPDPGSPPQS